MKKFIVAILLSFTFGMTQAMNDVDQGYIDLLSTGNSSNIKQVAQSIYKTGNKNTQVLDVAAEVLLSSYPTVNIVNLDSLAWLCRAIGSSQNSRYYSALNEVVESNSHRKLRKYAKKALQEVGPLSGKQYLKGSVDVALFKKKQPKIKMKSKQLKQSTALALRKPKY